jgi:hypothetical protein
VCSSDLSLVRHVKNVDGIAVINGDRLRILVKKYEQIVASQKNQKKPKNAKKA